MKTTIYLIRHGKTLWNQEHRMQGSKNSPLTDEGKQQALLLQKRLEPISFDEIIVSTSERAQETASLVFPNQSLKLESRIREIEMGAWEGELHQDVKQQYPNQWHAFFNNPLHYSPVGHGERFKDVHQRITPVVDDIKTQYAGKTIALVSHRITLKVLTNYLINENLESISSQQDFDSTSLTKIVMDENGTHLIYRNETSHYQ
ncbi:MULTISPECIES: histidine phosphatase family protein [unclassified Erysipelothrix]|uniref:histidine phosphatase family protein n=1 Tax=unclassified Erysipelothrix TaxID=2624170 RepID=UPI0013786817|nr:MULTISPECIES: histidine phosphatase family protein [unclassified Erysipelothrix]MBK2402960.1 histidine phosphatase family protein [Erysipelothrix sp. strain 2 (EsS2-6-Brazil)]MBK2404191.1 histidine phosphatase family protein [Erysipelothrix sp. strain 2 (EsS2-7-Brazil)]NBA01009.1 histidine phosphatase family protein [Erysipelothrix rhusiopathiae]